MQYAERGATPLTKIKHVLWYLKNNNTFCEK